MMEVVVAVAISISISIIITYTICMKQFEYILDYYQKYLMKIVLNEMMIKSLLTGKDKQQLLDLFERQLNEIEKGVEK